MSPEAEVVTLAGEHLAPEAVEALMQETAIRGEANRDAIERIEDKVDAIERCSHGTDRRITTLVGSVDDLSRSVALIASKVDALADIVRASLEAGERDRRRASMDRKLSNDAMAKILTAIATMRGMSTMIPPSDGVE